MLYNINLSEVPDSMTPGAGLKKFCPALARCIISQSRVLLNWQTGSFQPCRTALEVVALYGPAWHATASLQRTYCSRALYLCAICS